MERQIDVYTLPSAVDAGRLVDSAAVVIDVLRATTTVIGALAAGANGVYPVLEIEEARELKTRLQHESGAVSVLLGGERKGVPIDGFDLGNSPESFRPETVSGKTLVFTTTNGTVAMHAARSADPIFLAGFVNARAVVDRLSEQRRISILCAGTDGEPTEEDLLVAGCLVSRLGRARRNPEAEEAARTWETRSEPLEDLLRKSRGGRNLVDLGLDADIVAACRLDSVDFVPRLDPRTMIVR